MDTQLLRLTIKLRVQVLALDGVFLLLLGLVAVALHPQVVADGFHFPGDHKTPSPALDRQIGGSLPV